MIVLFISDISKAFAVFIFKVQGVAAGTQHNPPDDLNPHNLILFTLPLSDYREG
jgi:hypothetical protein